MKATLLPNYCRPKQTKTYTHTCQVNAATTTVMVAAINEFEFSLNKIGMKN